MTSLWIMYSLIPSMVEGVMAMYTITTVLILHTLVIGVLTGTEIIAIIILPITKLELIGIQVATMAVRLLGKDLP